ncbi:unnamed protein product [Rodentolepis nana]|uniref:Uncharacterized protein n=1 Tax=Rodentolepis nana TaxID=102285 RepID=A0A3P7SS55_RODNA|nr:unnamed protein product [Rodentolepis nana]
MRAVLLHTEALKSRQLFAEMAVCFIRLADIDSFLTGGLLLEQAAYCSLRGKRPLLRHFAMRLALAGVRFARAKQVSIFYLLNKFQFNRGYVFCIHPM